MIIIVLIEFILGITVLVVVKKFNDPKSIENKEWTAAMIKNGKVAFEGNATSTKALRDAWNIAQTTEVCRPICTAAIGEV